MRSLPKASSSACEVQAESNWWNGRAFWIFLALLAASPILAVPFPAMADLYLHIGRHHVMLNGDTSPFLRHYYDFQWALVPNLGVDLLMVLVGPLFGAERGTWIVMSFITASAILGLRSLSMALHNTIPPTALLALPFVFSFPFLHGFANFSLGIVLSLWFLAAWLAIRRRGAFFRSAILALMSVILFLCHMASWAVFAVALTIIELLDGEAARPPMRADIIVDRLFRITPLLAAAPILLAAPRDIPFSAVLWVWSMKIPGVAMMLRDQWMAFDVASVALLALIPTALLLARKANLNPAFAAAAMCLFAMYLIMPSLLSGSFYADLRILPMVAILAILSVRPIGSGKIAGVVAGSALIIFLVRWGVMTSAWVEQSATAERAMRVLEMVPGGSRIALLAPQSDCTSRWSLPNAPYIATLAIARRDAFLNAVWDMPGQLMRPIYNRRVGYNDSSSSVLGIPQQGCTGHDPDRWLGDFPVDRFDYIWVIGTPDVAEFSRRAWLQKLDQNDFGTFYAIRR